MPKRAVPTGRIALPLDARSPVPLYKQLNGRLRRGILGGQLERGTRLPSTRLLASELGISRTTVVLAYDQLLLDGYLRSRVGQGTIVALDLPVSPLLDRPERPEGPPQPSVPRVAARVRSLQEAFASVHFAGSPRGAYRGGEPAVEQFSYGAWARLIGWVPSGKDDRRATDLAATVGIEVAPLSRYSLSPLSRGGLLLSFANRNEEELRSRSSPASAARTSRCSSARSPARAPFGRSELAARLSRSSCCSSSSDGGWF